MIVRKKLIFDTPGVYIDTYTSGGNTYQHKIVVEKMCENDIYVKYLDRNCQYRFALFNSRYKEQLDYKAIGEVLTRIDDIDKQQNTSSLIGFDATKTITIYRTNVKEEEYKILKDIFVTPRLYLQVNNKWILAKIKDGNAVIRKSKGTVYNLEVTAIIDYRTITTI